MVFQGVGVSSGVFHWGWFWVLFSASGFGWGPFDLHPSLLKNPPTTDSRFWKLFVGLWLPEGGKRSCDKELAHLNEIESDVNINFPKESILSTE